ncbi:pyrroline-5-carboxylate reductase [Desulfocurvus sp.]|jgi:pyrroline-5-carboxylate reductase|uniref:pyrroline-5-carboxylate reductase n=1 Tax=Desulfocurvus sp. TaxID=2871698 RepID=UPI0025C1E8FF|nr:pyrroline-5-carboxylate reductase [Desulfocurvus sp.]MCK9241362.1 pyrroline-5-carboxylate reductase [Desulfocurvus sp.]
MTSIGFIGVGNMGSAIIRGLAARGDVTLAGYDLNTESLAALAPVGLQAAASPRELAEQCQIILLAVKPHQVKAVLEDISPALNQGRTVVSIAAGITMKKLLKWADPAPVVRVMPNTPAMVGAGVFALCLEDERLDQQRKDLLTDLFQGLGQVHVLPERLFDAFTAVAGSGPAYVFYFMEAVIEAGVTLGLTRQQATRMVEGLFLGSARLAAESEHHISVLREMVCSPAGTTIAATNAFDEHAVRAAILEGVLRSARRSKELGD